MQLYRVLPIVLSVGLFGCGNSSTQENANSTGTPVTENKDNFLIARGSNQLIPLTAQGWDAFLNKE